MIGYNPPQQAPPLLGVEPSEGVVKELNRVSLLLGHDNRPGASATEILWAERNALSKPAKAQAANPRTHRRISRWFTGKGLARGRCGARRGFP
jgi:hypothetical protein